MNKIHYLVWRRGFAPILFILAIALIVTAIGSGVYFTTKKNIPAVVIDQPASQPIETVATGTLIIPIVSPATIETKTKPVNVPAIIYANCGSSEKTAGCLAERVKTCSPTKGTVTDPSSGLKVERIIDGYKGNNCSYRTNIISGAGNMAILNGMDINCLIPRDSLATTIQEGSMSKEDMLSLCSGAFIDLIRAQMKATQ